MCDFVKVDDKNSIKLTNRWKDSVKFNSEGRFINKNNEYVKISYPGPMYMIMYKKERAFTTVERISRLTKFIFFNILSLGLCNFKKSFRDLLTKKNMVCRYAVKYDFNKINVEQYLIKCQKIKQKVEDMVNQKNEDLEESYVKSSL